MSLFTGLTEEQKLQEMLLEFTMSRDSARDTPTPLIGTASYWAITAEIYDSLIKFVMEEQQKGSTPLAIIEEIIESLNSQLSTVRENGSSSYPRLSFINALLNIKRKAHTIRKGMA